MPAARKTVPVDALREILGTERTDELLQKLSPPTPTVRVQVNELSLARVLFADPLTESKKWDATIPVLRRYFLDRGQARRHFLQWIEQAQADPEGASGPAPPPAPRRKVSDPAILEKRRAALAKARAVRSEKRRAAKAS
jgi:hypothetical protein